MRRKRDLPPGVYFDKVRYHLRRLHGRAVKPPVRLAGKDATLEEVWAEWRRYQGEETDTLRWLFGQYLASSRYLSLAESTRKEWQRYSEKICEYELKNGMFGDLKLYELTPGVIRQYLDRQPRVAGNRQLALLRIVFGWGIERDLVTDPYGEVIRENPCRHVRANPEEPRTRYVTHEEYETAFAPAADFMRVAMELAYLCRMRRGEILNARRSQILEHGFDTLRTKGSNDTVTLWSPRLTAAIDLAKALPGSSLFLIHDENGARIGRDAFVTEWRRVQRAVMKKGLERFTFHDLKAKGVSDFEGDKQVAGGWKSASMVRVYDRKKKTVKPTE